MKKKNYRLLSLLLVIPMFLAGCGNTSGGSGGGGTSGNPKVTAVKIAKPSETDFLDGSRTSLKATVEGDEGVSQKVTWSSSNDSVAAVTNGVVSFLTVAEKTKVTITATSAADAKFSDSVELTVVHSPFDLKNSRGNPDTSLYFEEGSFTIEDPQDVALIYADVHHTRWYVEATMQIESFDETDDYPKVGIMASERDDGMWTHEQSHQVFYYLDSVAAAQTWSVLNAVPENNDLTNWNWGGQIGPATASPAAKMGEPFKMGLMRDGNRFYQFYGKASDIALHVVGSFEYNSFGEDANYVWVGGWKTALIVSDPVCLVGDEIDSLYEVPQGLALKSTEEVLYLGDSYQIEVEAEGLWDRAKLTFASSNEDIATVDKHGVVTASGENIGEATITVGFAGTELSAEFHVIATDDKLYKVVLDGKMDDAIWSQTVKENSYLLKKNDNNYIRIYGAKNSKGLYLFMDYVVSELKIPDAAGAGSWWLYDNCEFYIADNDKAWGGQYWVSAMNGGSFVSVGSGEKPEEIFHAPLSAGEDELYHGAFEMFVPFGDDNVTKGEDTYICFGFNPKADWANSYNWRGVIDENCLNVTADGFAHATAKCSEGEHLGNWVVDEAPTCAATGTAHRDCIVCGHRETKVLDIDPEAHVFDFENAVASEHPTCTTNATAECSICHATRETFVEGIAPLDFTSHSDEKYPSEHSYCHDCGVGSHLDNPEGDAVDHNFGDWPAKANWYDIGVWSGDFTIVLEYHMEACQGTDAQSAPADTCWRTVLPILYAADYNASTYKVDHVFRMDWFGWTDGEFTASENNGTMPEGFDWGINYQAFSNMDVKLTVTKTGANVTLDQVWTCLATEGFYQGKTFEYHQSCVLVEDHASRVGFALTAEFANFVVTRADFSRA